MRRGREEGGKLYEGGGEEEEEKEAEGRMVRYESEDLGVRGARQWLLSGLQRSFSARESLAA